MAFDDPPEAEPNEFEMAMFYLKQGQKPSPKEVEIICLEVTRLQQLIGQKAAVVPSVRETDRVIAIVHRNSSEEQTHATVSCLRTDAIQRDDQMLEPISRAVTEWVDNHAAGEAAWKRSSRDFNVGDLSTELGDKDLQQCLVGEGVFELEIETFVNDEPTRNWSYDTVLYDETYSSKEE